MIRCEMIRKWRISDCCNVPFGSLFLLSRSVCNVKVFKDKGAERKQRQEQLKMEKLSLQEQAKYHCSQTVTTLHSVEIPTDLANMVVRQPVTPTALPQSADTCVHTHTHTHTHCTLLHSLLKLADTNFVLVVFYDPSLTLD